MGMMSCDAELPSNSGLPDLRSEMLALQEANAALRDELAQLKASSPWREWPRREYLGRDYPLAAPDDGRELEIGEEVLIAGKIVGGCGGGHFPRFHLVSTGLAQLKVPEGELAGGLVLARHSIDTLRGRNPRVLVRGVVESPQVGAFVLGYSVRAHGQLVSVSSSEIEPIRDA